MTPSAFSSAELNPKSRRSSGRRAPIVLRSVDRKLTSWGARWLHNTVELSCNTTTLLNEQAGLLDTDLVIGKEEIEEEEQENFMVSRQDFTSIGDFG